MARAPGPSTEHGQYRDEVVRERRLVHVGTALVDAYVGYRCWSYEFCGGEITLKSITRPVAWPRRDLSARCRCPLPGLGHACGIYAYASLEGLLRDPLARPRTTQRVPPTAPKVYGEVALWGRVRHHEYGYRAEHARLVAVIKMPCAGLEVDSCALQYGVPLVLPSFTACE